MLRPQKNHALAGPIALVVGLGLALVPTVGASAAAPVLGTAAASVPDAPVAAVQAGSAATVDELDLAGVDPTAKAALTSTDAALPDVAPGADPDAVPGLEVVDPIGVLSDAATLDVLTEEMTVDPFSVMGVTWDLDPALVDVVVQYRTFREGAWSAWAWSAPAEPYVEEDSDLPPATRGATDAIFVPDSTGVQVMVSSTSGTVAGVKVVLIDPGAGPEGDGASTSSGAPTVPTDPAPVVPDPSVPDPSTVVPETPAPETPAPVAPEQPADQGSPSPTTDLPTGPATDGSVDPSAPVSPTDAQGAPLGTGVQTVSSVAGTGATVRTAGLTTAGPLATAAIAQPRIITRAEWGVGAPACYGGYGSTTLAASIHHTVSTNSYTVDQVPGLLRGMYEYHTRAEAAGGRGWCDIGYNFLVDRFGNIYEGRAGGVDMPTLGVHTGGFNSRVIGVAAIGNFQDAATTPALNEGISQIIAWKFAQHRILAHSQVTLVSGGGATKFPEGTAVAFPAIFGHRDANLTSCPGQYLYNAFPDIRNRVSQLSDQVVAESPYGQWEVQQGLFGAVRVAGWAIDPGTAAPIALQVLVDGVPTVATANVSRPDVGVHGFDALVSMPAGEHVVCIRLLNYGGGSNSHMGCRTVASPSGNPVGVIDSVSATTDGIQVSGWARDPETKNPIDVHVYVGSAGYAWTANLPRPDVEQSAPGQAGPKHGFSGKVPAALGTYSVCVYGINVGAGANVLLGCRNVSVTGPPNATPIGNLEVVAPVGQNQVQIGGWALDPDTTSSISVHVYVDGASTAVTASGDRPDVAAGYGRGAAHGFSTTVAVTPGVHQVCIYAIDTAGGYNPLLGCRSVTVVNATPIGNLEVVAPVGQNQVQIGGWALDPDTTSSISVHVYVDGASTAVTASGDRPDVAAGYGRGAAHGFSTTVAVTPGVHQVCIYAIDTAGGYNPLLGCRSVTVVNKAPIGNIELVQAVGSSQVRVAGWALDPDTTAPISVHVYVDGASTAVTASVDRPDVGAAYGRGNAHGFDTTLSTTRGVHQVCIYGIDTVGGWNPLLSCRSITVT